MTAGLLSRREDAAVKLQAGIPGTGPVSTVGLPYWLQQVAYRAQEPHDADADSTPHAPDQPIQQKAGEPLTFCLHFAYYNVCRLHRTIRVTPGMEA